MKYIIVKTAVYDHGVMWIGSDREEAKIKANYLASNHDDGHHEYQVRLFKEPRQGSREWIDNCKFIYTGVKS